MKYLSNGCLDVIKAILNTQNTSNITILDIVVLNAPP